MARPSHLISSSLKEVNAAADFVRSALALVCSGHRDTFSSPSLGAVPEPGGYWMGLPHGETPAALSGARTAGVQGLVPG